MKNHNLKLKILGKFLILHFNFAFLIFNFSLTSAFADSLDPQIETIEKTYQQTRSLEAEFIQSTEVAVMDKVVKRHGRFFYAKEGKIRIEYGGEAMTHYISDGKTFWIWHPKEKNLETYSLEETGLPDEALEFLTGFGKLQKNFKVTAQKNGFLKLEPKKKTGYRFLEGKFDKKGLLTDLIIHNLSGNKSSYHFFDLKIDANLQEKLFTRPTEPHAPHASDTR